MGLLRTIVLIVAVGALLKGIWCLAAPGSAQKMVGWWFEFAGRAGKVIAAVLIAVGFALVALAVVRMKDPIVAAVTMFGTVFLINGLLYLRPAILQAVAKPFGPEGHVWVLRVTGVVLVALAILLFTICARAGGTDDGSSQAPFTSEHAQTTT